VAETEASRHQSSRRKERWQGWFGGGENHLGGGGRKQSTRECGGYPQSKRQSTKYQGDVEAEEVGMGRVLGFSGFAGRKSYRTGKTLAGGLRPKGLWCLYRTVAIRG